MRIYVLHASKVFIWADLSARARSSFATKISADLGRFRVKNATVRAGKSLCYGLRLFLRLFGVGNATVWGWKRDFMGFCNIMFEVVFLFFAV